MSIKVSKLQKYIREIIKQELEEASVTNNIDGGEGPPKTPNAFQSKRKKDKDKEKEISTNSTGYKKVNEHTVTFTKDEMTKLHMNGQIVKIDDEGKEHTYIYKESVNEGKYHDYKKDDTQSPKQKIGNSMREVRNALSELSKLIDMNVRLKKELKVNSQSYWKNTHKALHKISERLVKLANKVGQLQ